MTDIVAVEIDLNYTGQLILKLWMLYYTIYIKQLLEMIALARKMSSGWASKMILAWAKWHFPKKKYHCTTKNSNDFLTHFGLVRPYGDIDLDHHLG